MSTVDPYFSHYYGASYGTSYNYAPPLTPPPPPPPPPPPMMPPSPTPLSYITSLSAPQCLDWARGRCARGYACRFNHSASPTPLPFPPFYRYDGALISPNTQYDAFTAPHTPPTPQPLYFPNPQLSIIQAALTQTSPLPPMPLPLSPQTSVTAPCRDFRHGACSRGSNCRFSHTPVICADFIRHRCERGSSCRYSHDKSVGPHCRDFAFGRCARGSECRYYHAANGTAQQNTNGNMNTKTAALSPREQTDVVAGRSVHQ